VYLKKESDDSDKKSFMDEPFGTTLDWVVLGIMVISVCYIIYYNTVLTKKLDRMTDKFKNLNEILLDEILLERVESEKKEVDIL